MAAFGVSITYSSVVINGTNVTYASSFTLNVDTNEVVTFTNASSSIGGYTLSNLNNFNDNTSFTQTQGAPAIYRTATTVGTDAATFQCYVPGGGGSKNITINFVIANAVDNTLNSISGALGADATNISTSTEWVSPEVTVSGVDAGVNVTASVSGTIDSRFISKNNGAWQSTPITNCVNGDTVRVKGTTPSTYTTSKSLTLTLSAGNTVSDTVNITTIAQPTSGGGLIPFGHATGSIPMSDMRNFFIGIPENTVYAQIPSTVSISQLYKGGSYVPNITENASIPTSGTIAFSNFRNAYTSFSIQSITASKGTVKSTNNSTNTTAILSWYILDNIFAEDVTIGYTDNFKSDIEFYVTLQVNSTQNPSEPVTLTSETPTTWTHIDNTNRRFGVTKTVVGLDFTYNYGTMTIYARRAGYTSAIDSATVAWTIQFQGP